MNMLDEIRAVNHHKMMHLAVGLMLHKTVKELSVGIKHIANRDAREYVRKLEVFRGSNIFSEWYEQGIDGTRDIVKRYVVYSYRYNFPLFIYEPLSDTWYENSTKYSRTTAKHRTQLHPCVRTTSLCLEDMQVVQREGSVGLISYSTKVVEEMQDVPF